MKKYLVLFMVLCGLSLSGAEPRLVNALIQVESSGRKVVPPGDNGKALGPLQIHPEMVDDVNRLYGTTYSHTDMLKRSAAVDVCHKYLAFYGSAKRLGHAPTLEDHARIWNGGPAGWKRKATVGYWKKVKKHL